MNKRHFLHALAAATLGFCASASFAQAGFPDKPIKLVVPFAPDGSTDLGRARAELSEKRSPALPALPDVPTYGELRLD